MIRHSKTSTELAPRTSEKISELVPKYLDPAVVRVVNGGKEVVQELLEHPYGHILYTGGGVVGKIVMRAAAKHLTPVTLELGGKSPTIVTDKANLELAVKRIACGEFVNAGQTCAAPGYVLVQEVLPAFLDHLKRQEAILAFVEFSAIHRSEKRDLVVQ